MRIPQYSKRFRRDFTKMERSGKKIGKLTNVMSILIDGKPLPRKYRDHVLQGEWQDIHDCHIEGDWILLYEIYTNEKGEEMVRFHATDNHENLFG